MASEKRPPPGPSGGRRRPPTIELEATEVARGPVVTEPPDQGPAEGPKVEASPDVEQPAEASMRSTPPPQPDPPPQPPPGHAAPPGVGRTGIAWLPPGVPWRLIGAGAVGAVGVLAVLLLLWAVGLTPRTQDPVIALGPRLGAIETQLRELAARPQPATVDPKMVDELAARLAKIDPKALDELTARLTKVEAALASPRPPATDTATLNRVAATDDAVKALAAQVAQLTARLDAIAASLAELQNAARLSGADRTEIAALANKIAALEQSSQALRDELAKRVVASANDRAVRLAMLATALRGTVERGDPFAAELAVLKPLTANDAALATLEPFAAKGVPSAPALSGELAALIEPMRRAGGATSRDGGFIDRLQANAEKLVRIRPVGDVPGDEPPATIARIAAKAAQADIDGALAELAKLPAPARAPAQDWIAKAQARQAAVAAAKRFAAAALAALKTTP